MEGKRFHSNDDFVGNLISLIDSCLELSFCFESKSISEH